jgi:hypothetical protein
MNIEKIMNLQYRKVLTKKEEVKGYILTAHKHNNELIDLSAIEILSLFIIDLDNMNYNLMTDNETSIIKEYVTDLLEDNVYEKKELSTDNIYSIYELSTKYRISDELNKKIALSYAKYLNNNVENNMLFIGIDVLESLL